MTYNNHTKKEHQEIEDNYFNRMSEQDQKKFLEWAWKKMVNEIK